MNNTGIFTNLKGNIFGGITAGIIALPLALAFGVASGLGAAAGLWGAIIVCIFATIFGGTPVQISGPTGPMTVVVAALVLTHPNDFTTIFVAIALAGLIQILLSFSNVAKLVQYVPYPVISGFMSGIGIIIILLQAGPFLGLSVEGSPIQQIIEVFKNLSQINPQAFFLACFGLLVVFMTPKKIAKYIPPSLLALVIGTFLCAVFKLDIATIGDIPAGFPSIQIGLISFEELQKIIPMALTLAILGSIDSLLTSLVADSITNTKHNSNKELFGQGLGNMFAGIFGGLAGAGATMRTVVNVNNGGTTKLSGIIHSIFLITVVIFIAPLASQIPLALLSAVLIKVGIDIIDYKFVNILPNSPKSDLFVMLTVFALTVFDDLIFAVGVGIVLSSILFAAKISKQFKIKITDVENYEKNTLLDTDLAKKIFILHIDGVFFFGSAAAVMSRVEDLLETKTVIIDCHAIPIVDISAAFALEKMIELLKAKNINVILVLKNTHVVSSLFKLGLSKQITRHEITFSMERAIKKAKILLD